MSEKKTTRTTKEAKDQKLLEDSKNSLDSISQILSKSALELPSLVSIHSTKKNDIDGILQDKFKTDFDLISMLEEFFSKLVLLLKYRSSYDEKLSQISRQIKKLKEAETISEFKGHLQILGITLNDAEQIIRNYEEMYENLFTEQALLQFQLMEQLAMFKESSSLEFSEMFSKGIKTFTKLNDKFAKK
ncbi:MAG: hypothetical protein FK730_03480 [Asgard group archaeon]|nr:hypothetical protein [Asgard group archaeon]